MQNIRISKNFVPVSEFKAQASDWLKAIAADDAPLVVTQNGRPAAVVLSPRAYDALTEQARFVSAVNEGNADAEAGRVADSDSLRRRLRARYGG
jgi:prevent-host-death family protein